MNTKGSQPKLETVQSEAAEDLNDPNRLKFIPHVVHIERSQVKSAYKLWEHAIYQHLLKPEEQYLLMIEDCFYENTQGDLVDFAFGAQVGYVNIRGFQKNEKTQKVLRYSEILDTVKTMIREQEAEEA